MSLLVGQDLLSAFQLELNLALLGKNSLNALSQVDEVLTLRSGERIRRVQIGEAEWNLGGPRHRLGIRSRNGFDSLGHADKVLTSELVQASELAAKVDGRLSGQGMHPWMSAEEAEYWPHGDVSRELALESIFGEHRHGFANQQALGLGLPFGSDDEFERLWAGLRFVLPLLPAFAASSPFANGACGPARNCRLAARRDYFDTDFDFSCSIVPKHYSCREAVRAELGAPLDEALRTRSLLGHLQAGDVCGDGLLADFHSGLVHIAVLDMQESLQANLGVVALVAALTRTMVWEVDTPLSQQRAWPSARLGDILENSLCEAEEGVIRDTDYLQAFRFPQRGACRTSELLQFLVEEKLAEDNDLQQQIIPIQTIVHKGSLATRMLRALPEDWDEEALYELYRELVRCQADNEIF